MTDEALIAGILAGGLEREKALQYLYKAENCRNPVRAYVLANGGTLDDFKDVFQNALLALDRNIRLGRFEHRSKLSTYFNQIARWRWQEIKRSQHPTEPYDAAEFDAPIQAPIQQMLDNGEMRSLLDKTLDLIGSPCREMLRLYSFSYAMEEIGQGYGLTATQAKRRVHSCRENAERQILQNADLKQRYLELFNRFL
ncbi:MAG: RNA polymerase sigma factor [Saprospiraceae bacterium]